jgi:hypothetical protein
MKKEIAMIAVTAGVVTLAGIANPLGVRNRLSLGRPQLGFVALSALSTTVQLAMLVLLAQT